jgi:hypothetical protein
VIIVLTSNLRSRLILAGNIFFVTIYFKLIFDTGEIKYLS